jgi:hypothetical protein
MRTADKINNNKLSISDLELLKDALDGIFSNQNGFDLYVEDDQKEIVAHEYIFERLSYINDYRNKYVKDRLGTFNAYSWICDNNDFKEGVKKLYTYPRISMDYNKLAFLMLKASGYTGAKNKLMSMTFLQRSILHLNSGRTTLGLRKKGVAELTILKKLISLFYLRVWHQEHLIWMMLPSVINYFKSNGGEYKLLVKNSEIKSLIAEVKSLSTRCRGLVKELQHRRSGVDHALHHLNMASNSLSCIMPKVVFERESKSSRQKIFVIQVTRAFIDNGGISLGDGNLLELVPMPKHRINSFIYNDINPIFDNIVDNELKTEKLEAPIVVIMNSHGELHSKILNQKEVFDEISSLDLSLLDYAILEVWVNNDSIFGIRRKKLKYNHKHVEMFITNVLRILVYLSESVEELFLNKEEILKIIAHEVMAHAIELEILKRIDNECIVPNKRNEATILTII